MCSIVLFYDENIWMLPSIIVDMKDIQSKIKFALNNIKKISAFNPLLFDKSNNSRNLIIEVYLTLSAGSIIIISDSADLLSNGFYPVRHTQRKQTSLFHCHSLYKLTLLHVSLTGEKRLTNAYGMNDIHFSRRIFKQIKNSFCGIFDGEKVKLSEILLFYVGNWNIYKKA